MKNVGPHGDLKSAFVHEPCDIESNDSSSRGSRLLNVQSITLGSHSSSNVSHSDGSDMDSVVSESAVVPNLPTKSDNIVESLTIHCSDATTSDAFEEIELVDTSATI